MQTLTQGHAEVDANCCNRKLTDKKYPRCEEKKRSCAEKSECSAERLVKQPVAVLSPYRNVQGKHHVIAPENITVALSSFSR
jgi:hypothetical protein